MSYGKKDEDADQAVVKVDRTAVFQEGILSPKPPLNANLTDIESSLIQLLPHLASKMPDFTHQDFSSPLHWRKFPSQRSYGLVLWNFETLPEQGPRPPSDDVPCF